MSARKNEPARVNLPVKDWRKLNAIAAGRGVAVADLVIEVLTEWLSQR